MIAGWVAKSSVLLHETERQREKRAANANVNAPSSLQNTQSNISIAGVAKMNGQGREMPNPWHLEINPEPSSVLSRTRHTLSRQASLVQVRYLYAFANDVDMIGQALMRPQG